MKKKVDGSWKNVPDRYQTKKNDRLCTKKMYRA